MKTLAAPYHWYLENSMFRFLVYLFVVIPVQLFIVIPAKLFGLVAGLFGRGFGAVAQIFLLPFRAVGALIRLILLPFKLITWPFRRLLR